MSKRLYHGICKICKKEYVGQEIYQENINLKKANIALWFLLATAGKGAI